MADDVGCRPQDAGRTEEKQEGEESGISVGVARDVESEVVRWPNLQIFIRARFSCPLGQSTNDFNWPAQMFYCGMKAIDFVCHASSFSAIRKWTCARHPVFLNHLHLGDFTS